MFSVFSCTAKIIATDSITLTNELMIKKKIALINSMIRFVHGQLADIDRVSIGAEMK